MGDRVMEVKVREHKKIERNSKNIGYRNSVTPSAKLCSDRMTLQTPNNKQNSVCGVSSRRKCPSPHRETDRLKTPAITTFCPFTFRCEERAHLRRETRTLSKQNSVSGVSSRRKCPSPHRQTDRLKTLAVTTFCPFTFRCEERAHLRRETKIRTLSKSAPTPPQSNSSFKKEPGLLKQVKQLSNQKSFGVANSITRAHVNGIIKIDSAGILKLLDRFDSEDPTEREYQKTILLSVYRKYSEHRPFIRKAINNVFYRFIYGAEMFYGIAELLEVLRRAINGFSLPLKEEHKEFLVRVLIPLHKPKCLPMYHQQLSYCITLFVEKDNKLADTVIRGLLKYWPIINCSKELLFLSELEKVLEATQQPEFQQCMTPLFRRIISCMSSSHYKVAKRALNLWKNDHIVNLIRTNQKVILPVIFPALKRNVDHWNKDVIVLTLKVRKRLYDADPAFFNKCLQKYQEDEAKKDELKTKRETTWKLLEDMALAKVSDGVPSLSSLGSAMDNQHPSPQPQYPGYYPPSAEPHFQNNLRTLSASMAQLSYETYPASTAAPMINQTSLVHCLEPSAGNSGNFFCSEEGSFSYGAKDGNFPDAGVLHLQKICLAIQSVNKQEVPSSYSSAQGKRDPKKEQLFKVTTDLIDVIETRALGEDDHTAEADQDTRDPAQKLSSPVTVSTNKTPPKTLVPVKSKQNRVGAASEKSSSEAAGNVLGLANYSPSSNEEGDEIWSSSVTKPESSADTVSSIIKKHREDNHFKTENGHTLSSAKEAEVAAARTAAINFEIKQGNHEIEHILTEVLLKVTTDLFDEIETRALGEDDHPAEADQDTHDPAQKLSSPVTVSTNKTTPKALVPVKSKQNRVGAASEKSSSEAAGNVLGLANYLPFCNEEGDEIRSSSITKPESSADTVSSIIKKHVENNHCKTKNGHTLSRTNEADNVNKDHTIVSSSGIQDDHGAHDVLCSAQVSKNLDDDSVGHLPSMCPPGNKDDIIADHESVMDSSYTSMVDSTGIKVTVIGLEGSTEGAKRGAKVLNWKTMDESQRSSTLTSFLKELDSLKKNKMGDKAHGRREGRRHKKIAEEHDGYLERFKDFGHGDKGVGSGNRSSHRESKESKKEIEGSKSASGEDDIGRKNEMSRDENDNKHRHKSWINGLLKKLQRPVASSMWDFNISSRMGLQR